MRVMLPDSFTLLIIVTIGLLVMILSIRVLSQMVD